MKFDLVRPCGNCPMRSDRPPFFRCRARMREIIGDPVGYGRRHWPACSFPCHKTIIHGERRTVIPPTAQQCAGVMILLTRVGLPNDAMQLAQRLLGWDPARLDMTAPVYLTREAAIEAQAE